MRTLFTRYIICILLLSNALVAGAQQKKRTANNMISKTDSLNKVLLKTRGKSIYLEFFGPAQIYSVNYDTRFNKTQNGIGARIGAGYFVYDRSNLFTAPLIINYLIGHAGEYLEIGGGITYYNFSSDTHTGYFNDSKAIPNQTHYTDNGILGSGVVGYRHQPMDGHFNFRCGLTPVFSTERFMPFWPYISFGYSFKGKGK